MPLAKTRELKFLTLFEIKQLSAVKISLDKMFQQNMLQLLQLDFQISHSSLSSKCINVSSTNILLDGPFTSLDNSSLSLSMTKNIFHRISLEFKTC